MVKEDLKLDIVIDENADVDVKMSAIDLGSLYMKSSDCCCDGVIDFFNTTDKNRLYSIREICDLTLGMHGHMSFRTSFRNL